MKKHKIACGVACSAVAGMLLFSNAAIASVNPPKLLAVTHVGQNFGEYRRTVMFYEINDLTAAFDKTGNNGYVDGSLTYAKPLFAVFPGYERDSPPSADPNDPLFTLGNYEEISAITFNPANGMMYMASYDSGTAGDVDPFRDTEGVMDLYQFNILEIYRHHLSTNNDRGTIYAPRYYPDYEDTPFGEFGKEAGHRGTNMPIDYLGGWDDVNLHQTGPIRKIGELARNDAGSFFKHQLVYVNPQTLLFLDEPRLDDVDPAHDPLTDDSRIAMWSRISTLAGLAPGTQNADNEGGYNGQTAESWTSSTLARIVMDFDGAGNPVGNSEARNMTIVEWDGVLGVWVVEGDMPVSADDVAFFEIDLAGGTAAKKEVRLGSGSPAFPTGFGLQDPDHPENNGQALHVFTDSEGNLVFVQNNFFKSTTFGDPDRAPGVTTREILDYDALDSNASGNNEIVVGGWDFSGPITGQVNVTTEGRFIVYDKGEKHLYILDARFTSGDEATNKPVFVVDADPTSPTFGTVLHEWSSVIDAFYENHTNGIVAFGDMTGDGRVNTLDIDALVDAWKGTDDLLKEQFDLTGDGTATKADVDDLIEFLLGTAYGDVNLDGKVDDLDLAVLQANLGTSGGYGDGAVALGGRVDLRSAFVLFENYGFDNSPAAATIPEPASLTLLGLGGLALLRRRRA
ncbi:MAG: PEP-CTERM sorting domain-containing protein [Phycisphaeraceae bacterium]|nr:PEP-CTERM sorting domain-containing protein [Phycisphaeraceae bacterium]